MGKKFSPFRFALVLLSLSLSLSLFPSPASCATEHEWVWNVPVVPPQGGWEGEAGRNVRAALSWHEAEISDSGSGVGGHDIRFVFLPELDEDSAPGAALSVNARTAAVMSFAPPEVDRVLVERAADSGVPLLLAGGEEVIIDRNGRPLANVFALDLFRDYRCEAFALYAKRTVRPEAHLALAASRFTVNQEREAKICYAFLDGEGFMPMPFWLDASARDAFQMMSEEVRSSADGVVITFLGGMGAREMWRSFMRVRTAWRIWNCALPDDSYLSFRGMIFADQNLFLPERGGFLGLKRRMWNTRTVQIDDVVSAGRAEALVEWLKRGIATLPQPVDTLSRPALLQALERVRDIPFGIQTLDIAPELHRPAERQAYVAEVRERSYTLLDTVTVRGLPYEPGY